VASVLRSIVDDRMVMKPGFDKPFAGREYRSHRIYSSFSYDRCSSNSSDICSENQAIAFGMLFINVLAFAVLSF